MKTIENVRNSISSLSTSLLKADNILQNIESSGIGSEDELNKLYHEEGVYWPILSHLKMIVNYLDLGKYFLI